MVDDQEGRGDIHEQTHICIKKNLRSSAVFTNSISKIQHSLSASCFRGGYKIVVLQTLSGRHHTSALCSVGTLFLRPASVEERQEGQQASEKQGKKTCRVHWNKVNTACHTCCPTHPHDIVPHELCLTQRLLQHCHSPLV